MRAVGRLRIHLHVHRHGETGRRGGRAGGLHAHDHRHGGQAGEHVSVWACEMTGVHATGARVENLRIDFQLPLGISGSGVDELIPKGDCLSPRGIRIEDDTFTLERGSWTDGDADTETVFEVGQGYRDGDAFVATSFSESFAACADDVCREVMIQDFSDEPFKDWDLTPDKSRWSSLPCSFL